MAALVEPARQLPPPELHDLRDFRASDLEQLLLEEEEVWRGELDWEFEKSAVLVRKFLDLRALSGSALVSDGGVVGYCYFVVEEQKGLLGDVFLRRAFQTAPLERLLLGAMVEELIETPGVNRIESQLMLLLSPLEAPSGGQDYCQIYPRDFLKLDLNAAPPAPARRLPRGVTIETWTEAQQDAAARVIAATYEGHVDGLINDQYMSAAGARRFLYNIVQYPGCGAFFDQASFTAFHRPSGEMRGLCLASIVGEASGHITQICVAPRAQGQGLGYELLRRSLDALRLAGCTRVSLTVTTENRQALTLYQALGFRAVRRFAAYVWEGW